MSLIPSLPRRPLTWSELVQEIAARTPDRARLYLVGGVVRDALRGIPAHDIDLVTHDDGLKQARQLANALGGAYYPVDSERHVGRIVIDRTGKHAVIDVASFRGPDLLADLAARDFTINAMAVRLDQLDWLIDPLGGQRDLFDARVLRQCSPTSIGDDPIRALRAVRQGLQFGLRLEADTRAAVRAAALHLAKEDGTLRQPERVRDEVFKALAGKHPASILQLLHALGLWRVVAPAATDNPQSIENRLAIVRHLSELFVIVSPQRDDNIAASLVLGVAVMVLDRYRHQLQEYLAQTFADGRAHTALLLLGAFTPPDIPNPGTLWAERLRLSNAEEKTLNALQQTRPWLADRQPLDNRQMHRYYRNTGETGIAGVLLMLAESLAANPLATEPTQWGSLLEEVAAPLLDAFFRRHQQIVAPPALITGDDLMHSLGLKPGPHIGYLLERIAEGQAAGEVRTRKEALRAAERLITTDANLL